MRVPSKYKFTEFVQFDEYDCRQVNLHIGRTYNYWFIEPSSNYIKLKAGNIPDILIDKKIGILNNCHKMQYYFKIIDDKILSSKTRKKYKKIVVDICTLPVEIEDLELVIDVSGQMSVSMYHENFRIFIDNYPDYSDTHIVIYRGEKCVGDWATEDYNSQKKILITILDKLKY